MMTGKMDLEEMESVQETAGEVEAETKRRVAQLGERKKRKKKAEHRCRQ